MTRVTVVGDCLLDRDWTGTSERLCPDSAGPVVDLRRRVERAGGAALAAVAAARAGVNVRLVGAVGSDEAGQSLRSLLDECGVELIDLGLRGPTPEKVRVRVANQTVVRLDVGCQEDAAIREWRTEADHAIQRADAVLVSDYGRGLVEDRHVRTALERRGRSRPVVWDPHPRGPRPYSSTTRHRRHPQTSPRISLPCGGVPLR